MATRTVKKIVFYARYYATRAGNVIYVVKVG